MPSSDDILFSPIRLYLVIYQDQRSAYCPNPLLRPDAEALRDQLNATQGPGYSLVEWDDQSSSPLA
jgi:hypothetical protein